MTDEERNLKAARVEYLAARRAAERAALNKAWDKACREYLADKKAIEAKYAKENADDWQRTRT